MTRAPDDPDAHQLAAIEHLADALYDLLRARAQSLGIVDIQVEPNGWFIDAELVFATGPDAGCSIDTNTGECSYCELIDDTGEQWGGEPVSGITVPSHASEELLNSHALAVLNGLTAARRVFAGKAPRGSSG